MANPIKGDQTSLQPNTSQEGLEAVSGKIGTFILKIQSKVSEILYGAYLLQGDRDANGIKKAIDRGIINLLRELSAIDFCNIFSYLVNSKLGKGFDPKKIPLPEDPTINKVKFYVQNKALQTQSLIDNYFAGGISINELVRSVNLSLSAIINNNISLSDPELRKEYPEVDLIRNFLNDKLQELSNLVAASANGVIPTAEIQKVVNTMTKIRSYCVAIQALNNPASLIGNIPFLQEQLRALDKIVKPEKLVPLITRMLKTCNKINDVCKTVLGYVTKARLIIRVALLLIKIFNLIKAFFISLPIPNIYTSAGVSVKFSEIYQENLKQQGEKKLIKVLKQISAILDDIYSIVNGLVIALNDIILNLTAILLNIQRCGNGNDELINNIKDTINGLENTKKDLQKFIDEVNEGRKKIDNTFGGYTIEIVSEELTDEGIKLKRRFGIARGQNGIIAVQSKPTFASLDLIIINEVKVLLISQGLVSPTVTGLSPDATIVAMEAMKYLDDNDIDLQNISSIASEIQQEDGVGLQSFVNDLPGGKALRKRVRKKMVEDGEKLGKDLKSSDPNSQYSAKIAKDNKDKTKKLKIEELEDQKRDIQKQISAASLSPATAAVIPSLVKKIKELEEKIEAIKRE